MRSLSVKIILVLVVVSLAGALFTTFYLQTQTKNAFDTYLRDQSQWTLADLLIAHYHENSSWENVESVFKDYYEGGYQGGQGSGAPGRNPNRQPGSQSPPFVLTDSQGTVIAGFTNHPGFQIGDRVPAQELKKSLSLEIDGSTRGYLAAVPFSPNRNSIQQNFLETIQRGLIISSLVALLIALALGSALITSFTRPIRKLVDGTERVADGDLGYQVAIKSKDELGRLARSFNHMSRDLKNADLNRKQMTADIAHDLRTPLSILYGYTEALNEKKMVGNPEIYQVMHQQAQHLNYLIEDLRTLSLLDSEEMSLQIQNIDPGNILKQTQAAFQPLAEEKGVKLILDLEDELPRVDLDPDRLTQILGNLINNALNVLPAGGIIQLKARNNSGDLAIEVSDNGPGISPEDLPNIFHRHYRTDKSRGQGRGSSGLGLAITKKLVEAQGGSISVESILGEGSAFRLTFPAA